MIGRKIALLFVLLLFFAVPVNGGDILVVPGFRPGGQGNRVALPHLTNKGMVAEFLDRDDTGIGKSVAYLLWREVLTAISDQAGAGVILAHPPGQTRVVDLLKENYHRAAVDIATHQGAPLVMWGIAREEENKVYLSTFFTLIPEVQANDLCLHIDIAETPVQGWEAEIKRTRFNFALLETNRTELFQRPVITRRPGKLRAGPSENSPVLAEIDRGVVLAAKDMRGSWFEVETSGGHRAFVDINQVELPPRTVEITRSGINMRQGPGANYEVVAKADLNGVYEVLDMRFREQQGLWYKIRFRDGSAWVAGFLVRPRFSCPVVHFMAGLYRYRAKRYDEAQREFTMFVSAANVQARNTNLATAYQLAGISNLMAGPRYRSYSSEDLEPFNRAVELTPYDPAAFNLRALARIGVEREVDGALDDLGRALELDGMNSRSRLLLESLDVVLGSDGPQTTQRWFRIGPQTREKFQEAKRLYGID